MDTYKLNYLKKIKKTKNADYFESDHIPPVEVYDIKDLREINIFIMESDLWADNLSVKIPRSKIVKMQKLERLKISHSDIDDEFFKNEICQLKSLKKLSLHSAFLTTIPDEIINLCNLEEINIRFSRKTITSVSNNLNRLPKLKDIFIECEVDIIPIVFKNPALKRFSVKENYEGEYKKYLKWNMVNLELLRQERN